MTLLDRIAERRVGLVEEADSSVSSRTRWKPSWNESRSPSRW
ncbi:hypothetical protein [Actinomadura rupiterrae]|nr:hypothetical protein [Actinomadura rupiterrae]MCP2335184.1 hypothetical protein [Actinomadura rupiterrae]